MEKPFQIEYKGFKPSEAQNYLLEQKTGELQRKFERIAAGRITISAPSKRHRSGGLFDINIRLRLPMGKEVDISRTPDPDERYGNFQFAVNDTFRRALRQLQKYADRIEGEVKLHAEQPIGTVTKLFENHGFLEDANGLEVYFHQNSVLNKGFARLRRGTRVAFTEEHGNEGPQASNVRLLGKRSMR